MKALQQFAVVYMCVLLILGNERALARIPRSSKNSIAILGQKDTLALITYRVSGERPDEVVISRKEKGSYYQLARFDSGDPEDEMRIEKPVVFRYKGEQFIYVQRTMAGTGHYHDDTVLCVLANGGLQGVRFESAPRGCEQILNKGEGVWKGVGHFFKDDSLGFSFGIWKEGDANCCPTGGSGAGTYKIVKGPASPEGQRRSAVVYRMSVENCKRLPP